MLKVTAPAKWEFALLPTARGEVQLHRTGGRSGRSGTSPYRGRLALSEVELRPTTDGWLLAKWNFAPLPKADG